MNDAKVGGKIRGKIEAFSGKLSRGLPKVGQRLVREVLYGVQSRGSVRLSEIGRALGETTGMKKVIERLGRGLHRAGLRERVRKNLLEWAAGQIESETLLVLDPTVASLGGEIPKPPWFLQRLRPHHRPPISDLGSDVLQDLLHLLVRRGERIVRLLQIGEAQEPLLECSLQRLNGWQHRASPPLSVPGIATRPFR